MTGRPSAAELLATPDVDEPTTVYIARKGRRVLYVGITGRNLRRMHAHARASEWWPQASRVELRHLASRPEALALERELIREWSPPYNVMGVPQEPEVPERPPGLLAADDLATLGFGPGAVKAVMRALPHVVIGTTHYVTEADYLEFLDRCTYPAGTRP